MSIFSPGYISGQVPICHPFKNGFFTLEQLKEVRKVCLFTFGSVPRRRSL
jgi:hypothetical protein